MTENFISNEGDLRDIISKIEFKNTVLDFNWRFEIETIFGFREPRGGGVVIGWFVNAAFDRPDTHTGEVSTGRGRKEFIQYHSSESGVVKTCWLLVELIVRHELMEGFCWDGCRIFNPHHSVRELASLERRKM